MDLKEGDAFYFSVDFERALLSYHDIFFSENVDKEDSFSEAVENWI